MKAFADDGFKRKDSNVKGLRSIFKSILGYTYSWEVFVGKEIAKLIKSSDCEESSLRDFLGEKLVKSLKLCEQDG